MAFQNHQLWAVWFDRTLALVSDAGVFLSDWEEVESRGFPLALQVPENKHIPVFVPVFAQEQHEKSSGFCWASDRALGSWLL